MIDSGADFSLDRVHRYRLWRRWADGPTITFCMLNPSTADEVKNDPTVERCERRARAWGYGRLIVVNAFALRSTDPRALRDHPDPVGFRNDASIEWALRESSMFVCGWGAHGWIRGRGPYLLDWLRSNFPGRAHALKINKNGAPAHPLYLPYYLKPEQIV